MTEIVKANVWMKILGIIISLFLAANGFILSGLAQDIRELRATDDKNDITDGNLQIRLATIEANRFTIEDGLEIWKVLAKSGEPAEWLVDRLDRLETKVESLIRGQ